MVKNLPASGGSIRDMGSIPGSGRSSGGGHGNPLQYSCLENPMDRGACRLQLIGSNRVGHDRNNLAHTYVCVCFLFQVLFLYGLLENIKYSSLCYTVSSPSLCFIFSNAAAAAAF